MNNEETILEQGGKGRTSFLLVFSKTFPSFILLICAFFGIFVGMKFLTFLDNKASRSVVCSEKWSNLEFKQLQQMSSTIQQELNLILEQYKENNTLQKKVLNLTEKIQDYNLNELKKTVKHKNIQDVSEVIQNRNILKLVNIAQNDVQKLSNIMHNKHPTEVAPSYNDIKDNP